MAAVDPMGNVTGYAGGGYLPEDQGIGRLNAGSMDFADGGIVGYAGGGEVERYSGMYGSVTGEMYDPVTGMPLSAEGTGGSDLGFLERIGFFNPENRRALEKAERAAAQKQTAIPYNQATMPAKDYTRTDPRATSANTFEDSVKAVSAAPTADTGRKGPSAGPTAGPVAGPRAPAQAGLGDLATTYADILKKQDYKDPAEARLKALEKLERTAAEDAKAALLRDQAKFEDAYKGREKRLSDRELDIGKQKDTNTGLAFLNAGLAIMSTPGGLATAIGKGAQVGTAQFAAGLDKIRSAQERLADARDRLEDLQLNRAEMSAKEIRAAEKSIRNVGIDAQKRTIDGIRAAANVTEARATDIYKSTVQVGIAGMEIQGRKEAAQIAAGPGYERNQMLRDAQGNEAKVRATQQAEFGKLQSKVMDTLSKDANYQMANPVQQQVLYTTALRQAILTNPFLASYAADIGFSKAPAGTGKVYDLTED
jgi:hypothetical protein